MNNINTRIGMRARNLDITKPLQIIKSAEELKRFE
jgi:hypothetical protein